MSDIVQDGDRDVCAREAAAAIDAVLDRQCPEMKLAFWRAVEKHYRLNIAPGEPPSPTPEASVEDRSPVGPH